MTVSDAEIIIVDVCSAHGIDLALLRCDRRCTALSRARQACAEALYNNGFNEKEIVRAMRFDRATIRYYLKKIAELPAASDKGGCEDRPAGCNEQRPCPPAIHSGDAG